MRRTVQTKLQHLEARYADLREKVHAMFNACWPAVAVQQLIELEYGARLGRRSVERYQHAHWQAQRELIGQALNRANEPLGR